MRRYMRIIPFVLLFFMLLGTGVAIHGWYVQMNKKAAVDDTEIETPPLIYIRDDNMEEITSFNLAGLSKGTDYNFIFCVVPTKKGTAVSFQLAVAYTGNLGMNINLYPISEVTTTKPETDHVERELLDKKTELPGTFYFKYNPLDSSWAAPEIKKADGVTNKEENQNPNDGTRKTYKNLTFANSGPENPQTYVEELNDQRGYRFFVMSISWEAMSGPSGSYEKEVDLIYIIARGTPLSR